MTERVAKRPKRNVIIPHDSTRLDQIRKQLKFAPLDLRTLVVEAQRQQVESTNIDELFRQEVIAATSRQFVALEEVLGLDQADPKRFEKGFALLSMALLGLGMVTYKPIVSKPERSERWGTRHDGLLLALVASLNAGAANPSDRAAIIQIVRDPKLAKHFPYKVQERRHDPRLSAEQRKVGALLARYNILKKRARNKSDAVDKPFLPATILGSTVSQYQYALVALDIDAITR